MILVMEVSPKDIRGQLTESHRMFYSTSSGSNPQMSAPNIQVHYPNGTQVVKVLSIPCRPSESYCASFPIPQTDAATSSSSSSFHSTSHPSYTRSSSSSLSNFQSRRQEILNELFPGSGSSEIIEKKKKKKKKTKDPLAVNISDDDEEEEDEGVQGNS